MIKVLIFILLLLLLLLLDVESILTEEWINDHTMNIKEPIKQGKEITRVNTSNLADTINAWSLQRYQFIEKFSLDSGLFKYNKTLIKKIIINN